MPPSLDVTVPVPLPAIATVSTGFSVKLATTDFAAEMFTEHVVAVPAQAPDHPLNKEFAAA
jgi:hypothetical protein